MIFDAELLSYATVRQLEVIRAIEQTGSQRKAAKALGVAKSTVQAAVDGLRRRAALQGWSPAHDMTKTVPEPFVVRGTSTLYKDGIAKIQWVKTRLDDNKHQEMMLAAIEGFKDEIPKAALVNPPALGNEKLCNCYVITDYHFAALSWIEETGADWNSEIAEETIIKWFQQAIAQSPKANYAVFAQLSDLLHFDGMDAVTPASKHLLDVDSRFSKVVRSIIRILRAIIKMLLEKYSFLHLIMADANHDPVSQIWLREWFSVLFEDEPRITVDTSPNPYNAYEFGNTALFFHHGHKRNVSNVSVVFASQFREIFGRTKYAYAHMGHLHHIDIKENNLMIVEQHRTLAANDAYGARGGYLSGRDAKVITYHREFGEVSRLTINTAMLA
jgi:hypothetical protein